MWTEQRRAVTITFNHLEFSKLNRIWKQSVSKPGMGPGPTTRRDRTPWYRGKMRRRTRLLGGFLPQFRWSELTFATIFLLLGRCSLLDLLRRWLHPDCPVPPDLHQPLRHPPFGLEGEEGTPLDVLLTIMASPLVAPFSSVSAATMATKL